MKKIKLFITAIVGFSTAATAQTSNTLQLTSGKTYQVDSKIESKSSTDVQGQNMESNSNISSTYKINVKDKTGDNYNLINTVSHLKMETSMMGQQINFDSDNKEDMDGQLGIALKDYLNKPVALQMDNTGMNISDSSSDSSASGILKQLNLAQSGYGTELAFLPLPKNVKAGTTWIDSSNIDGLSKNISYSIKDVNGNIADIIFSGKIATSKTVEQSGMEIVVKTSGTMSGNEKVDINSGIIQSSSSTTDASGTVNAMGQDFPTTSKITTNTTIKEI